MIEAVEEKNIEIQCPECKAKYLLKAESVKQPKTLKCLTCGYSWLYKLPVVHDENASIPQVNQNNLINDADVEDDARGDFDYTEDDLVESKDHDNQEELDEERDDELHVEGGDEEQEEEFDEDDEGELEEEESDNSQEEVEQSDLEKMLLEMDNSGDLEEDEDDTKYLTSDREEDDSEDEDEESEEESEEDPLDDDEELEEEEEEEEEEELDNEEKKDEDEEKDDFLNSWLNKSKSGELDEGDEKKKESSSDSLLGEGEDIDSLNQEEKESILSRIVNYGLMFGLPILMIGFLFSFSMNFYSKMPSFIQSSLKLIGVYNLEGLQIISVKPKIIVDSSQKSFNIMIDATIVNVSDSARKLPKVLLTIQGHNGEKAEYEIILDKKNIDSMEYYKFSYKVSSLNFEPVSVDLNLRSGINSYVKYLN
jgi:hypothetical protein